MKLVGLVVLAVVGAALPAAEGQTVDVQAVAAAIMQADQDFNQAVADKDRARFLSFLAETAVFNGGTPSEWRGREAIMQGWAPYFEADGPTLTWEPLKSEVLVGGDVGYTIGSWIRRARAQDGSVSELRGQYVTTWLKQKDGSWKIVFDIGSTQP